ncbi:Uncharacterised protein [Bordetella pertussis]|nr:Uncharacterised protein [Bordetella pertussis]
MSLDRIRYGGMAACAVAHRRAQRALPPTCGPARSPR